MHIQHTLDRVFLMTAMLGVIVTVTLGASGLAILSRSEVTLASVVVPQEWQLPVPGIHAWGVRGEQLVLLGMRSIARMRDASAQLTLLTHAAYPQMAGGSLAGSLTAMSVTDDAALIALGSAQNQLQRAMLQARDAYLMAQVKLAMLAHGEMSQP